jgi:hypothetical protein
MKYFAMLIFAAMFLPACAVSHQAQADKGVTAFVLSDARHSASHHKFNDDEYLRGMTNFK